MQQKTTKLIMGFSVAAGVLTLSYYVWKRFRKSRIIQPFKSSISIEGRPVFS